MSTFVRQLAGTSIRCYCEPDLSKEAEWLLEVVAQYGQRTALSNGVRVQVGWSILTLQAEAHEFWVCEPDFDRNPFTMVRRDVSCTLRVQSEQNAVLKALGLHGVAATFQDKVIFEEGCLDEERVYLERTNPTPGDSGWYIGKTTEGKQGELKAMYLFQLLMIRPALLKVMALPPGHLVVFNRDAIDAITDAENREIWAARAGHS